MVGLAAELRDAGVCSNAISGGRHTRAGAGRRNCCPAGRPGAAFASAACTVSGRVLTAAGGRFSAVAWNESHEVNFGPSPASVDDIAARWDEIAGTIRP